MKLGLGSVQFGLDYGLSNHQGKTPLEEVISILEVARQRGIRVIDTAALYGNSEEVLGRCLPKDHDFDIVTKTPRFSKGQITRADADQLERTFRRSLVTMSIESAYGLMIHHVDDLLLDGGHLLMERILSLKQQGLVKKIGVSVYTAVQIDRLLDRYAIDLIQIPINVFDQRLLRSGHLDKLKKAGIEIHSRSVFLQGLLLMEPSEVPSYFESIRQHLIRYQEKMRQEGLTLVQAAIGFVAGMDLIDVVICGVNNHNQLQDICSSFRPVPIDNYAEFALSDESIINPSLWKSGS